MTGFLTFSSMPMGGMMKRAVRLLFIVAVMLMISSFTTLVTFTPAKFSKDQIVLFLSGFDDEDKQFSDNLVISLLGRIGAERLAIEVPDKGTKPPSKFTEDDGSYRRLAITYLPQNVDKFEGFEKSEAFKKYSVITSETEISDLAGEFSAAGLIVLWGTTIKFGDGVILLTQVSVPPLGSSANKALRQWAINFDVLGSPITISVPFSTTFLEAAPSNISIEYIKAVTSSSLPVYENQYSYVQIGEMSWSDNLQILANKKKDNIESETENAKTRMFVNLTEKNLKGWIELPDVFENATEISALVNGIIAVHLGSFTVADSHFETVLRNPATPHKTQLDVNLMSAYVQESWGISARKKIERALDLDPHSRIAAMYMVMSHVSELRRALESQPDNVQAIADKIKTIEKVIKSHRGNFLRSDAWLDQVNQVLKAFQPKS